jgi:hypothetical protein
MLFSTLPAYLDRGQIADQKKKKSEKKAVWKPKGLRAFWHFFTSVCAGASSGTLRSHPKAWMHWQTGHIMVS